MECFSFNGMKSINRGGSLALMLVSHENETDFLLSSDLVRWLYKTAAGV